MPTYYLKDGMRIEMRPKEHGHSTPHVHVIYGNQSMSLALNGEDLAGTMDRKHKEIASKWIADNSDFLKQKWKEMH